MECAFRSMTFPTTWQTRPSLLATLVVGIMGGLFLALTTTRIGARSNSNIQSATNDNTEKGLKSPLPNKDRSKQETHENDTAKTLPGKVVNPIERIPSPQFPWEAGWAGSSRRETGRGNKYQSTETRVDEIKSAQHSPQDTVSTSSPLQTTNSTLSVETSPHNTTNNDQQQQQLEFLSSMTFAKGMGGMRAPSCLCCQ